MGVHLTKEDISRLHAVKEKIDKDFTQDITYQELVRKFHINDNKLRHGFKQLFGQSIRDYQEKLRINFATSLMLEDGDITIIEVSYACGYNDTSTFHRAFYRNFNMPPGQWKKNNHLK